MKIDDWFTKTMLVNTLSRSEKAQSQNSPTNILNSNPFGEIFAEFLSQLEGDTSGQSPVSSVVSNLLNTENYFEMNQNLTAVSSNDSLRYHSRSIATLNQDLKGALAGKADSFVRAGKLYNLDPALLTAIAKHESGNGTSKAAQVKNNIAGMMGRDGLKSYASVDDSIMDMARNLNKNYLGQGLSSIAEIGAKYAPVGASNDPTGLNNYWVKGVTKYYNQLNNSSNDNVPYTLA